MCNTSEKCGFEGTLKSLEDSQWEVTGTMNTDRGPEETRLLPPSSLEFLKRNQN
jgi:hypothetical protein